MSDRVAPTELTRFVRAARSAGRRQRLNAALRRLARLLPVPLVYAAVALGVLKWLGADPVLRGWLGLGAVLSLVVLVVGVVAAWVARRPKHAGALALDRHHQSHDRITNALAFAALPPAERTPFMDAAIADALVAVERPSPKGAVPIELPKGMWVSVALALGVVALSQLDVRRPEAAPELPTALPVIDPVALSADDIALLRESVEELEQSRKDPELASSVGDYNRLIEDIAARRLDRQEAFRRLAALERTLSEGNEGDAALGEALKDMAEQLAKSPLSRPLADALKERRLEDAEAALRELAERLKERDTKINSAELERLRKALEAASQQSAGRVERLEAARRSAENERRRLLQKKNEQKNASPADQQREEEQRRKLERLERDVNTAQQNQEQMSELDRDLAKAAQELMKELGESAKHLESGAEDVNRMARRQMSQEEKQRLKQQLEELRQMLRQGGAGKEEQLRRLERFARRARGQKGQQGQEQGPGGQQEQPGKGGPGGKGGERLMLGPGGQPIPVPMPGNSASGGQKPGSGEGQAGGREWGSGSDDNLKGRATDLEGKTEDVSAAAVDTGQGTASSEVVFGAAERGFTGARYQKVYTQYRTVAEDVLERDEIPAGYESYVRRYFQLIRPRDDQ